MNNEQEESLDVLLAQAVQQMLDTSQSDDPPADLDAIVLEELSRFTDGTDVFIPTVADSSAKPVSCNWLRGYVKPALISVIVLVACAIWSMMSNNRSVLAEAIRQMAQARSLQCVLESKAPNDEWVKTWKFEYDRRRGFRLQDYENNVVVQTEIDDRNNHWIHRQGHDVVTRGAAVNVAMQLQKMLSPIESDQKFQPSPANDQLFHGVACRCYIAVWEKNPPLADQRVSVWTDQEGRAHRFLIEHRVNEKDSWVMSQQATVEYDIELDAAEFAPRFPENARIIDLSKVFDETCSLDKAIHREVQHGYELAVHDIKRISLLEYYLLLSFRPTEETRRKLKLGPGEIPGDLFGTLRSEMKHYPPNSTEWEVAHEMASARADGVLVKALFCEMSGDAGAVPTQAQPGFTLFANSRLWKQVPAFSEISIKVPLPEEETPLNDVVRSVYDLIAMLEAIHIDVVQLEDEKDDRVFVDRRRIEGGLIMESHRKSRPRPSEIPFETFFEHIQAAPWRKAVKTKKDLADQQRQIKEEWGSEAPLEFLRELNVPEQKRPEFWRARLADLIKTPDPIVQTAAIEYAEKLRSLQLAYFSVLPVLETSSDPRVKAAADRLLTYYRRPVEHTKPAKSEPSFDFPIERIEKSIKQLNNNEKNMETIKELRELTGLDYGDGSTPISRQHWTKWWSHERDSINNAANGNREFIVYGRITNAEDKPLAAIPVQVQVSTRLFAPINNQAAYTESDNNGRFTMRFGFFKTEPAGMPIVNFKIQSTKFVFFPAWVGGNHILSRIELDADPHSNIRKEGIIFSGRPMELNIVQTKPDDSDGAASKSDR